MHGVTCCHHTLAVALETRGGHAAPWIQGWQHGPWNRPNPGQAPLPGHQQGQGWPHTTSDGKTAGQGCPPTTFALIISQEGATCSSRGDAKLAVRMKHAALPPPALDPISGHSLLPGPWGISAPAFPAAHALPGYIKSSDHTQASFFCREE